MGLLDEPITIQTIPKRHKRSLESSANRLLKVKKVRRGKRSKHKRKIPLMSYRQYIGSAYWKKRKNDYFGKYGKKCAVCGQKNGVTLHHKKYDNKLNGKEPDDFFVALCGKHHGEFHQNHKLKTDMQLSTDLYVHTMKQVLNSNIDDLSWI
jgi:hypothetical protein